MVDHTHRVIRDYHGYSYPSDPSYFQADYEAWDPQELYISVVAPFALKRDSFKSS